MNSFQGKPRLLLISATYTWEEPRKKIAALADRFALTCITSQEFVSALGTVARVEQDATLPSPSGASDYRLIGLSPVGAPVSTTKYILRGLGNAVQQNQADIILVESEPWALVRWQSWLAHRRFQPKALFGEFSWENTERNGLKRAVLRAAYYAAVRTSDFVIAGNLGAVEMFRRSGLEDNRLLVSPQLGVDESAFCPGDEEKRKQVRRDWLHVPEKSFVIGYAGRLELSKGLPDLISAVEASRASSPQADVRLCLLGAGAMGAELARKAAQCSWLSLQPPASHAQVASFMQAINLFVLPSLEVDGPGEPWKEQFGHVLIEAAACGTPTLASDSGAIPEVLDVPALRMIYPWREPARLAERLRELVNLPPTELAAIGRAQREHTLANFTHAMLAQKWATFLKEMLAHRRRG